MTNHPWAFSIAQVQRELGSRAAPRAERFHRARAVAAGARRRAVAPGRRRRRRRRRTAGAPRAGHRARRLGPAAGARRCAGRSAARAVTSPWPPPTRARRGSSSCCAAASATPRPSARCPARAREPAPGAGATRGRAATGPVGGADHGAAAQSDAHCAEVMELFFGLLGNVAGNLALTLGARGGVYVGGGIVLHIADRIERSRFRERFEAEGPVQGLSRRDPDLDRDGPGIARADRRGAGARRRLSQSPRPPAITWLKPPST